MDVDFSCSHCGQKLCIDEQGKGLNIDCPMCKKQILVPTETSTLHRNNNAKEDALDPDKAVLADKPLSRIGVVDPWCIEKLRENPDKAVLADKLLSRILTHSDDTFWCIEKLIAIEEPRVVDELMKKLTGGRYESRKAAAEILIRLATEHPDWIGDRWQKARALITEKYVDNIVVATSGDPNTDDYAVYHGSKGIGLEFPDPPPTLAYTAKPNHSVERTTSQPAGRIGLIERLRRLARGRSL